MKKLVLFASVVLLFAGCSVFVRPPEQTARGGKVVCFLYKKTKFKNAVIQNVSETLSSQGFTVVRDNVRKSKYYSSADYGAVVYMAQYWQFHTPWHAKRYFNRNKESRNTLFVVTSGNPKIVIKKPFDAITSASKKENIERVSKEITEKIGRILK